MLLNLLHQGLAKGQNEATAQVNNFDFFRNLFANFKVGFDLDGFGQRNLEVFVFYGSVGHDGAVAPNLKVALVGVNDDVKVVVG